MMGIMRMFLRDGEEPPSKFNWKLQCRFVMKRILRPTDKLFVSIAGISLFVCAIESVYWLFHVVHLISTLQSVLGFSISFGETMLWVASVISIIGALFLWGKGWMRRIFSLLSATRQRPSGRSAWWLLILGGVLQAVMILLSLISLVTFHVTWI